MSRSGGPKQAQTGGNEPIPHGKWGKHGGRITQRFLLRFTWNLVVNDSQKSLDFPQGQRPDMAMLTDHEIDQLEPQTRTYELHDGSGLYLRIFPQGTRYWSYCYQINGKKRRISIGNHPEMTVAQARMMCAHIKTQKRQGVDFAPVRHLPRFLLEGVPRSEANIAEVVRIAALKARAQLPASSPETIEERLAAVERQLERLTTALLTLATKIDNRTY